MNKAKGDFISALCGDKGEFDAWLEVNTEQECRDVIIPLIVQRDELLADLKLALIGIEAAIETAQKYEDETFLSHVLTADKLRFTIKKAES